MDRFLKYGYVDHLDKGKGGGEVWQFSASHTLGICVQCLCHGQWAKRLGKEDDYKTFIRLSNGWEQLFDPSLKLVRPKLADGYFIDQFRSCATLARFPGRQCLAIHLFCSASTRSIGAKDGTRTFNKRLDSTFIISEKAFFGGGANIDAFAGIAGIYNHGNQPNLHVSWLFNFSGKPSLTQKWVRSICDKFYGTEGVHGYGFGQDEDQGQLGAWYVIAGMGLFDVKGLADPQPQMGIAGPLFNKVTIQLNRTYYPGNQFVIETKNNSDQHMYIQSMQLNGKSLHQPFVSFTDITKGGKLLINMGEKAVDQY